MVAAVLGRPYHISFGGSTLYQYAPDVARTFIAASRARLDGAHTANLGGTAAHMRDVVALIEQRGAVSGGHHHVRRSSRSPSPTTSTRAASRALR